MNRMHELTPNF